MPCYSQVRIHGTFHAGLQHARQIGRSDGQRQALDGKGGLRLRGAHLAQHSQSRGFAAAGGRRLPEGSTRTELHGLFQRQGNGRRFYLQVFHLPRGGPPRQAGIGPLDEAIPQTHPGDMDTPGLRRLLCLWRWVLVPVGPWQSRKLYFTRLVSAYMCTRAAPFQQINVDPAPQGLRLLEYGTHFLELQQRLLLRIGGMYPAQLHIPGNQQSRGLPLLEP